MSIGSPLTNSVPAVGTSGTGYATTINALLNEIKTYLEGTVPYSSLSGTELDMTNLPIVNISYSKFYDQGATPSTAIVGRLVYANGEFWAVNASGAIQITSGLGLNASGIGGIGGDYGGSNPALVSFVDTSSRYDFYDDRTTSTWAYQRSRGLDIAAGATSTTVCQIRFGGAGSYTLTLPPSLPASNRSAIVLDSTGAMLKNDATNTITNDLYLAGTTRVREIGRKKTYGFSFYTDRLVGTGSAWSSSESADITKGVIIGTVGTSGGVTKQIDGLDVGTTITSVNVRINKQSTGTASCALFKCKDGTVTAISLTGGTSSTSGWQNLTLTGTYVVESGYSYHFKVVAGNNNDVIESVEFTYNS